MGEDGDGAAGLRDAHFAFDAGGDFEEGLVYGEGYVAEGVGCVGGGVLVDEGVEGGG